MAEEILDAQEILESLDAFKPVAHVSVGGRDWPIFKLSYADFRDAQFLKLMKMAADQGGDQSALGLLMIENPEDMEEMLWVLLRKGAPGMTPERMLNSRWTLTKEQMLQVVSFLDEGEFLLGKILEKVNIGGGGTAEEGVSDVNPSLGNPSTDRQAGQESPSET